MKKTIVYMILLTVIACRQRYDAPVSAIATGYLVVEGVVDPLTGGTELILTRTSRLDSIVKIVETNASVNLKGDDNSLFLLTEQTPGHYLAANLQLNSQVKYKLHIFTAAGKEYVSDAAPVLVNPPIDSINWTRENGGVQIYINTHNPLNNTRYYQWEFNETWEFHSEYWSSLKYKVVQLPDASQNYSVVYRDSITHNLDSSIHACWQFRSSTNLQLGSSAKLSADIIHLPMVYIPKDSWELSVLYRFHIRQFAWTKEGYQYLEIMKKNTESTGSIFDAQPSQLTSNIHCLTNPDETVLGYFNISPIRESTIFIKNKDLPDWNYRSGCYQVKIENISDSIKRKGIGLTPTEPIDVGPFYTIALFFASNEYCVDCTLRGTNIKPSYWP